MTSTRKGATTVITRSAMTRIVRNAPTRKTRSATTDYENGHNEQSNRHDPKGAQSERGTHRHAPARTDKKRPREQKKPAPRKKTDRAGARERRISTTSAR